MVLSGKWYFETIFPDLAVMLQVREVLHSGHTAYQQVEVLESETFGLSLVLDGKTQSTERDEFVYHEALVHPAMSAHPGPRTVFIGGGGEGGTLREALSHRSVERVVMLDLDPEVVGLCRRFLPNHHQGSFDDPRVDLRHEDARAFLQNTQESFDVMIMDLVDPLEDGTAYQLYTEEYYQIVKSRLNPGGIMVTQSGPAGLLSFDECYTTIYKTLGRVFDHVLPSHVHVPAFQTMWGMILASDSPIVDLSNDQVDERVAERVNKELGFYDGETHRNMFSLPKYLRKGLKDENRINTDSNPVFMV